MREADEGLSNSHEMGDYKHLTEKMYCATNKIHVGTRKYLYNYSENVSVAAGSRCREAWNHSGACRGRDPAACGDRL